MEHELFLFSENKNINFIGYFENNIRRGGDNMLITYL